MALGVPSLFSLRSPKLGLWRSQPLRGCHIIQRDSPVCARYTHPNWGYGEVNPFEADILFTALSPVCSRSAHPNWGYGEVNPFGAVTLSREIPQSVLATLTQTGVMEKSTPSRLTYYSQHFPQSVLATLAQTGVMEKSTPSGLIHKQSRQIAVVDVGQQGPIPVPVHQRTINEHQFLAHPNCREARSSVRKQRLSTVVAAPCAGLVSSEHTNITLMYTHCRACLLWQPAIGGGTVSVSASDDQTMNIHYNWRWFGADARTYVPTGW